MVVCLFFYSRVWQTRCTDLKDFKASVELKKTEMVGRVQANRRQIDAMNVARTKQREADERMWALETELSKAQIALDKARAVVVETEDKVSRRVGVHDVTRKEEKKEIVLPNLSFLPLQWVRAMSMTCVSSARIQYTYTEQLVEAARTWEQEHSEEIWEVKKELELILHPDDELSITVQALNEVKDQLDTLWSSEELGDTAGTPSSTLQLPPSDTCALCGAKFVTTTRVYLRSCLSCV